MGFGMKGVWNFATFAVLFCWLVAMPSYAEEELTPFMKLVEENERRKAEGLPPITRDDIPEVLEDDQVMREYHLCILEHLEKAISERSAFLLRDACRFLAGRQW